MRRATILAVCVVLVASSVSESAAPLRRALPDGEELLLAQASISTKPAKLLGYLERRCGDDADLSRITSLVEQLGHSEFDRREDASKRLTALGPATAPALIAALSHKDLEVSQRAGRALGRLSREARPDLMTAAVRLVARRAPEGAATALLRCLPFAEPGEAAEEVWFALDTLASKQTALDPAFEKAFADRLAVRRAAAGFVLARYGDEKRQRFAHAGLKDEDAEVRLRVAQGFLGRNDDRGVRHLIDLLRTGEVPLAWQAEELLHWMAGGTGPRATVGHGAIGAREECRRAWLAWWRARGPRADFAMAKRWGRTPRLLLVHELDDCGRELTPGIVWLCGSDGRARWQLSGLARVTDLQLLPNGRLLMAEARDRSNRIGNPRLVHPNFGPRESNGATERDLDGTIRQRYDHEIDEVVRCQRLLDGTTILEGTNRVTEFSPISGQAREIDLGKWRRQYSEGFRYSRRTSQGTYLALAGSFVEQEKGVLAEVDPTTARAIWTIPVDKSCIRGAGLPVGFQVLPGGNFLVGRWADGKTKEVDRTGRVAWESPSKLAYQDAYRLGGGNTLMTYYEQFFEFDPAGRMIWEALAYQSRIHLARPCANLVRLGFRAEMPDDFDVRTSVGYHCHLLRSEERKWKFFAASRLRNFKGADEAAPDLLRTLPGSDERLQNMAASALKAVAKPSTLPLLLRASRDRSPEVRSASCVALSSLREKADDVLPALLRCLRDDDPIVRRAAAGVLGSFRAEGKRVVPELIRILGDSKPLRNGTVAEAAASALTGFPKHAKEIVPALIEMSKPGVAGKVNDRSPEVRAAGCHALYSFRERPEVLPALLRSLRNDDSPLVRRTAAGQLDLFPVEGKRVVPALLEAIRDTRPLSGGTVSGTAAGVLTAFQKHGKEIVPALIELTKTEDLVVTRSAIRALGAFGEFSADILPVVKDILKFSDDDGLRRAARETLERIDPRRKR